MILKQEKIRLFVDIVPNKERSSRFTRLWYSNGTRPPKILVSLYLSVFCLTLGLIIMGAMYTKFTALLQPSIGKSNPRMGFSFLLTLIFHTCSHELGPIPYPEECESSFKLPQLITTL